MTKQSNEEIYKQLSKEQLIELAKIYGRLALTIDGFWFMGVENLHNTDKALELDEAVWRGYGKSEGKLLKRFLSIHKVTTLEEISQIFLLTPIFGNCGAEAEIRNGNCFLSITNCHPQKARVQKGLGEFPCKCVGIAYFEGMLAELNPEIRFECVFCPPDEHPEGVWCGWEAWIGDSK